MPSTRSLPVVPALKGRGVSWNPPNRFERLHLDREGWTDPDDPAPETVLLNDATRTILSRNDSPDVGFDVGVNPYRGCAHGCSYCYARRTHEYLGFSAGLDFETKVLVKHRAAELLRDWLARPAYQPALRDWCPPDLTNDLKTFGAQSWPEVKRLLADAAKL